MVAPYLYSLYMPLWSTREKPSFAFTSWRLIALEILFLMDFAYYLHVKQYLGINKILYFEAWWAPGLVWPGLWELRWVDLTVTFHPENGNQPCHWDTVFIIVSIQGCTNPRRQVSMATKFCTVAPKICRAWILNLLRLTLPKPKILGRLQVFFVKFLDSCFNTFNTRRLEITSSWWFHINNRIRRDNQLGSKFHQNPSSGRRVISCGQTWRN